MHASVSLGQQKPETGATYRHTHRHTGARLHLPRSAAASNLVEAIRMPPREIAACSSRLLSRMHDAAASHADERTDLYFFLFLLAAEILEACQLGLDELSRQSMAEEDVVASH